MSLKSRIVSFASQSFPRASSRVLASSGYTLDLDSFGPDAFQVWGADAAGRQDRAWQPLVAQAIAGEPREDIAALFDALDSLDASAQTILEVGCGGGYNSELIAYRAPRLDYTGVDLAPSMVEISRASYPDRTFAIASALDLPYDDGSFDIVMDGVALLHIPDWQKAITEYARVSRHYVMLHGLTLTERPTVAFAKYAYGQPSREFVFNRDEVLAVCTAAGLSVQSVHPGDDYDLDDFIGIPSVSETWVLTV